MAEVTDLLKKSGYSDKAIEYYTKRVNFGEMESPSVHFAYTGICGDTMEIYLKVESDVIKDAKFRAIGCPGAFASGSALMEMIKGKTLGQAEKVDAKDVIDYLGSIPKAKVHCACLAERTLKKAIQQYKENR
jgi:nitrogen fixation NifU-like protein